MLAYVLTRYGGPEGSALMEFPEPKLRPRDILVNVRAAGLNPVDIGFRQGKLRPVYRLKLPQVLGNEFAGEVVAVGDEVTRFSAGDRVFARVEKDRLGAFAEQAAVGEDCAAHMPSNMDFEEAAGVPLAALTALQALRDELGVKPGQKVFISGGAGGVGTFAIQIAKWLGAHVTTTASKRGEALVRSLGADEVIDYTSDDLSRFGKTGAFSTARRYGAEVEPLPEGSGVDKLIALASASYDPFRPTHQLAAASRPWNDRLWSGRSWRKAAGRYRQCMSAGGAPTPPINEGMGRALCAIRGID
ncbi:NADP-dependent oxidoreductase [Bradyrhizobium sp. RT11b]|uniref:NADP-dependent oxidoreductase n=1 Tax=Bradyrhizobium sp. RT11b TaxID=3156332 RepID=UPI003399C1F9